MKKPYYSIMEKKEDLQEFEGELRVTHTTFSILKGTARWARFLAIVGFLMSVLMIVGAIIFPGMMSAVTYSETEGLLTQSFTAKGVRFNFILLAILVFLPCYFLFRFAVKMKDALQNNNQDSFVESFLNLRSTFKFFGILTIFVLAVYAIAFIFFIIFLFVQV